MAGETVGMSSRDLNGDTVANVNQAMTRAGENPHSLSLATGINRTKLTSRIHGIYPFTLPEVAALADHFGVEPEELTKPAVAS